VHNTVPDRDGNMSVAEPNTVVVDRGTQATEANGIARNGNDVTVDLKAAGEPRVLETTSQGSAVQSSSQASAPQKHVIVVRHRDPANSSASNGYTLPSSTGNSSASNSGESWRTTRSSSQPSSQPSGQTESSSQTPRYDKPRYDAPHETTSSSRPAESSRGSGEARSSGRTESQPASSSGRGAESSSRSNDSHGDNRSSGDGHSNDGPRRSR
jgi:hypothetical protein